jgi:hypothetical protein
MKGFPVGTIIPWSGATDTIPSGWIPCVGTIFPITRYPLLHEIIGNVYGGTSGSTFALPRLDDGKGIVDIYPGHFNYLQNKGNAHKPDGTTLANDAYWSSVGQDEMTSNNFNQQSLIDVVCVRDTPSPRLVANVTQIVFTKGNYFQSINAHPRKLSDRHQRWHNHAISGGWEAANTSSSWRTQSGTASTCGRYTNPFGNFGCGARNTQCEDGLTWGTRVVPNSAGACYVNGGSNALNNDTGLQNNGDGFAQGNMYANTVSSGGRFASSLSDANSIRWADISGHSHTMPNQTFTCNVNITGNYTFFDITSNNVGIDGSQGVESASINIDTQTANLRMVFIIRAY